MSSQERETKDVLRQFELKGRVAIVTGGARGLGRQHALTLAEAGADMAICDRLEQEGEQTRKELETLGVRAWFGVADVTAPAQIDAFLDQVEQRLGPIRILVNNAARPSEGCALTELSDELWRAVIETNLSSVFYFGKRVAARMIAGKTGIEFFAQHRVVYIQCR